MVEALGVWIKRDDLTHPRYGGNKVRKLEYLLAEARARGTRVLVTTGGIGSNFVVAATWFARAQGLEVVAVHFPQPLTEHVRENLLVAHALGARYVHTPHALALPLGVAYACARAAREGVAWVPPGGSSVTGTLGYVEAALELAAQVRAGELPEPRAMFVAAGSSGTFAGLRVGVELAGLRTQVVGVRVVDAAFVNRTTAAMLATRTWERLRRAGSGLPRRVFAPWEMDLDGGHLGRGYGHETPASRHAVERAAEHGVRLETVYTGKAFAGMRAIAEQRGWSREPLLFWNTFSAAPARALLADASADLPLPPAYARYA